MPVTLSGKIRSKISKSHTKGARQGGLLPAVVYGQKETVAITVNQKDLIKIIKQKGINALIELDLQADTVRKVLLKDYQAHPLKEMWMHADFYEVNLKEPLKVRVPVKLVGMAPGVKKGGTLNRVTRTLSIKCLPDSIPEVIEVPIDNLDLDQAIHISDLNIPEGVDVLNPASATVAIIHMEKKTESEDGDTEGEQDESKPVEATDDADKK